ncbi:CBO0543 family protein [Bacillus alkalicellulosilyticus]|uniref:CBO0543 family protein n=1 Tax=Alkalihalobacterium alkalicellulosilyticum TaxID=1912214 RepID=UPI0014839E44|nr:CBO0543 family protein [Bacillus alkalicellulosilyticus]
MMNKFEKKVLLISAISAVLLTPLSFIGKDYKKWIMCFLINSYTNVFVAPALATNGYLRYPVRLFPKIYKSSIIYDYFICSLITTWYCRFTLHDNWHNAIWKVLFFAAPQAILELWFERNTKLIKYNRGWTGFHSFVTIALAKYVIRLFIVYLDKFEQKQDDIHKT